MIIPLEFTGCVVVVEAEVEVTEVVLVVAVVFGALVVEITGTGPSIWTSTYASTQSPRRRPRRRRRD